MRSPIGGALVLDAQDVGAGFEEFLAAHADRLKRALVAGGVALPPGRSSVALYVRTWGPSGTDLDALPACARYLVVRERIALPGEDPSTAGAPIPLGNGTTAHGQEPTEGCGTEATGYQGEISWLRDGRSIVLMGNGVTAEQFLAIARSLDGWANP